MSTSSPDFMPTRWTMVVAAAGGAAGVTDSRAQAALGELAQAYWYPLYVFVRRQGCSAADAEDITQSFFVELFEKRGMKNVDREKGRFRSFLLASMKHFLSHEREKMRAQKRRPEGGLVALEFADAEARYRREPVHEDSPERQFERRWAMAVLDRVMRRLEKDYATRGEAEMFTALKGVLTGGAEGRYADLAAKMGTNEGAVKVAAHRLRRRYRDALREEIAQTVAEAGEVDEEIAYLLNCL